MGLKIGNNDVTGVYLGDTPIVAIYKGTEEIWRAQPFIPTRWLKFTAVGDQGFLVISRNEIDSSIRLYQSRDHETWTRVDTMNPDEILLREGESVYVCGYNPSGLNEYDGDNVIFEMWSDEPDFRMTCEGDVTSLIDCLHEVTTIPNYYCFYQLFKNCDLLISAPTLPCTTLLEGCYAQMFMGCTNLTQAPDLPATTLAEDCYREMFKNSGITSIRCLGHGINDDTCAWWFDGVPLTGTFRKSWDANVYTTDDVGYKEGAIPSGWNIESEYNGRKVLTCTYESDGTETGDTRIIVYIKGTNEGGSAEIEPDLYLSGGWTHYEPSTGTRVVGVINAPTRYTLATGYDLTNVAANLKFNAVDVTVTTPANGHIRCTDGVNSITIPLSN